MAREHPDPPTGIISPHDTPRPFQVARFLPDPELSPFVAHFWWVSWEIAPGQVFVQQTIPFPVVHVVFEAGEGNIQGLVPQRFTRRLRGTGWVFGAHLRPGTCTALVPGPASSWVGRRVPLSAWFPEDGPITAAHMAGTKTQDERIALMSRFLLRHLPDRLPSSLAEIADLADRVSQDRGINSVQQVASLAGVHPRTLQRRFRYAVGVSPKWLIRRRRIHDALARIDAEPTLDLTDLALDLGWFDQAHFARDFKSMVGMSATAYATPTRRRSAG